MFEGTVRHFKCIKSTPLYGKNFDIFALEFLTNISPIVPHIPNDSFAYSSGGLLHGMELSALHVFCRNHQHSPVSLQGLEAKHGFQVFQHIVVPPFKSFALNERIEPLMTDWFQIIHFLG